MHEVQMIVRSSLDLPVRRQLVGHNVAHDTHARRRQPTGMRPRSWIAQELADFLDAARPQRLYPALHLAAFTGMRRGEVVGLKWSDLDKPAMRLSISRTLQNVAGNPVEFDVKTRTSRRCIDIDDTTMQILEQWRREFDRDGLPHGTDDWMFANTGGRFLNPDSVSQLFDRIVKR
ncbi:MAG: site-specific integrase, partial [Actinomycetota bacterium]|nr:site-specific integrase [Actinomycetota bacterium]